MTPALHILRPGLLTTIQDLGRVGYQSIGIAVGGALTGEHGIGMEKNELMSLIFSPDDLALMARVRSAFNPAGRLNPGKVLPLGKGCGEVRIPQMPASATTPV